MEVIIERACGLDVHKETVTACVMGEGIKKEIRTFSTMTNDLLGLKEWLKEQKVTHVAMESTGIYWKPVFNLLEDSFELLLVNARHIKHVPGRKTDVQDSEWLCKLLRNGLAKGSFVPPRDIRELRDLTRYKRKLVQAMAAEKNRVQKILEDANIKLSSVVSDTFGASGSQIVEELMKGELTIEEMADLARGKLKQKKPSLKEALVGNFSEHHHFMIKASLEHIKALEKIIEGLNENIDEKLKAYQEQYELLQTIPGVKEEGAASIIAEIGVDMERFPSAEHLSSWAGMSPGNNESAGKKKASRTTHGNKCLKSTLTQCGWGASRTKKTYLREKYYSLVGRRGKKRALVAVGHKILVIAYHILKEKVGYKELATEHLKKKGQKVIRHHIKRLESLGYEVLITKKAA
jgi:transposase